MTPYVLTQKQLLADLYNAYLCARRHKRNKTYVRLYESRLDERITALCRVLWERRYQPRPSTCFIITDPKKREVFAADFEDRIVHHLYYNYVHEMFERTFIADSYSCIKGRGTHYGIDRLEMHIRQESQNYTLSCYVLKMDIRGYFMHINRRKLLDIVQRCLRKMSNHRITRNDRRVWAETIDVDFLNYLSESLVLLDPTTGCVRHGKPTDWNGLPDDKSLFCAGNGCGLPIGNLTSQLFSNVYLNCFDQYVKRVLMCRHYGRYVDDSYVVSTNPEFLRSLIPQARAYLKNELGLGLHEGKLSITEVRQGVTFLGAFLKPGRRYVSNSTLRRMKVKMIQLDRSFSVDQTEYLTSALNSYLGVLSHSRSYNVQRNISRSMLSPWKCGTFERRKNGLKFRRAQ